MSIRHKIFISNIILVCVPILLVVLLWFGYVHLSDSTVINPLNQTSETGGSLSHTQQELYLYESELAKVDWTRISVSGEIQSDTIPDSDRMILSELSDMGYHLLVVTEGNVIFDNLTESDANFVEKNSYDAAEVMGSLFHLEDKTIIRDIFEKDGQSYFITAVYDESGADNGTIRSLMPIYMVPPATLWFSLLLVLSVTVLTGFLLSQWLGHSILKPLDAIRDSAGQIAAGNLDHEMESPSSLEFSEVRDDFEVMREKLKVAESERADYEAKRKEMLSGISHDLRSPLTSIKGYTMGLKDGIADTEEKKNRYYDAILTRTKDMEGLLASLSELVSVENVAAHLHTELVTLDEFLLRFLKEQEVFLSENNISVAYNSSLKDSKAYIDPPKMRRVFTNLFENTIKYRSNPQSQVHLDASVIEGKVALIRYVDDGPGVGEHALPRLFDSFYRADESRTKPENGSGLGLAIVKEIIEGHGGSVSAFVDGGLGIQMKLPLSGKDGSSEENTDCGR